MPATNVLHIQGRAEGPPTVVALHGTSIRVGRGRRCEVQLSGSRLAEIQCILRKNQDGWYLQPLGPPGLLSIYGEPVYATRPIDFNVPVRVGEYWLTLRNFVEATEQEAPFVIDALEPETATPPVERPPLPDLMAPLVPPAELTAEEKAEAKRLREWEASLLEREQRLRQNEDKESKSWESKWRAAGERLRRQSNSIPATEPRHTPPPVVPRIPRAVRPNPVAPPPVSPRPKVEVPRIDYRPPRVVDVPSPPRRPSPMSRSVPIPVHRPIPTETRELPPSPEPVDDRVVFIDLDGMSDCPSRLIDSVGSESRHVIWPSTRQTDTQRVEAPAVAAGPRTSVPVSEPAEASEISSPPEAEEPVAEVFAESPFEQAEVCLFELESQPEPEPSIDAASQVFDEGPFEQADVCLFEPEIQPEPEPSIDADSRVIEVEIEALAPSDPEPIEQAAVADIVAVDPAVLMEPPTEPVSHRPAQEPLKPITPAFTPVAAHPVRSRVDQAPVFPIFEADWHSGPELGPIVDFAASAVVTNVGSVSHGSHSSVAQISRWEEPVLPLGVIEDREEPRPATSPPVAVRPPRSAFTYAPPSSSTRSEQPAHAAEPEARAVPLPSAGAILAAQGTRVVPEPVRPRKVASGPRPTEYRVPEQWNAPFWLAAIPALGLLLALGGGSLALSFFWAGDDQLAATALKLALRSESESGRLDSEIRPNMAWYRTTATHLAAWALAIERSGEGGPAQEEAARLLEAARHIAPLHPVVRYALAQAPNAEPAAILGLSRDAAALALAADRLHATGKITEAIALYHKAFEVAETADSTAATKLSFDADSHVRRYLLPRETEIRLVARRLVDQADWPYSEWSACLPASNVVRLSVARMLREKGSSESEAAFDAVLAVAEVPGHRAADHWAARAEALAFRDRGEEAVEAYTKAIEAADDVRSSRLYSYNLAEILRPMARDDDRVKLLQAATSDDPGEEITRRALDAQALSGLTAARSNSTKTTRDLNVDRAGQESDGATSPSRGEP